MTEWRAEKKIKVQESQANTATGEVDTEGSEGVLEVAHEVTVRLVGLYSSPVEVQRPDAS